MDTDGHEQCADHAGEPVLRTALQVVGKGRWRINGFYLGNWLTDVSQAVDPVAIAAFKTSFMSAIDGVIAAVRANVPRWLGQQDVITAINARKREIQAALGVLEGGRNSDVARAFTKACRVLGYKKFVHAARPQGTQRRGRAGMDFQAYKHVFDNRFTQYYPHEHLDRFFADGGSVSPARGWATTRVDGTLTPNGHGSGASSLQPGHLYDYLRRDVKIAAGLLADIDLNWARNTFTTGGPWTDDTDPVWNEWLAKLGHAAHAVEDYFAHSNFIELAIDGLSNANSYRPRQRSSVVGDNPWDIYRKRLKRWSGTARDNNDEWTRLAAETHVATGYFDFVDTFFSLRHVYEELFGEPDGPPDVHSRGWKFTDLLRNTIERTQTILRSQPGKTPSQAAREALQYQYDHGDADMRAAGDEVLNHFPQEMKNDFFDAVALFAKRTPQSALSLYDACKLFATVADYVRYPVRFMGWLLGEIPGWVRDAVARPFEELAREVLDQWLGRYRVGCHSLLAKDYAWGISELDSIYRRAKAGAKAVHWYVVRTMVRWAQGQSLDVCRADATAQGSAQQRSCADRRAFVDWLELLEYFLRHPWSHPPQPAEADRWWHPVVTRSWNYLRGYTRVQPYGPGATAQTRRTSLQRAAALPHRLIYVTRQDVERLRDEGNTMRTEAEQAYDVYGRELLQRQNP
ncbi:MAG: hypothetical protein GY778_15645 [bacterium]|nr:hypothetical protein [bacterium]